jgi:hypothetical protein
MALVAGPMQGATVREGLVLWTGGQRQKRAGVCTRGEKERLVPTRFR